MATLTPTLTLHQPWGCANKTRFNQFGRRDSGRCVQVTLTECTTCNAGRCRKARLFVDGLDDGRESRRTDTMMVIPTTESPTGAATALGPPSLRIARSNAKSAIKIQ